MTDPAEHHAALMRATGGQPYTPPLEEQPPEPEAVQPEGIRPTLIGETPPLLAGIELEAAGRAFEQGLQGIQVMQTLPSGEKVEVVSSPLPVGAATGMFATPLLPAANQVAKSFGEAMASIGDFLECASELLDQLDEVEDDDGRAIWLTAGEVELDQWLARLVAARDAMRDRLAPRIGGVIPSDSRDGPSGQVDAV